MVKGGVAAAAGASPIPNPRGRVLLNLSLVCSQNLLFVIFACPRGIKQACVFYGEASADNISFPKWDHQLR